ncbi:MAG: hypothetical protein R3250_01175 [Melioribacteraceae bacterium]|nr:hypothetical protein [Melioribacteraceae bacterium]
MVNQQKNNQFQEFLEKHKKKVKIYNIFIWTVLLIMLIILAVNNNNNLTYEEMQAEVDKRCSNNITLPKEGVYRVKFNTNTLLNITTCEVVTDE